LKLFPISPLVDVETHFWPNLWSEASSDELERDRHALLSGYKLGSKQTHVFTDTVRICKRVFEFVFAGVAELTATPLAK